MIMSQQKLKAVRAKAPSKPNLTPEEIAKKRAEAEEKARKAKEEREALEKKRQEDIKKETESDQAWLDQTLKNKSEDQKNEFFIHASRRCKETIFKDGKITLACPIPKNIRIYCVEADKFTCTNGKTRNGGCNVSAEALKALNEGKISIDSNFMFEAEGGSFLSPYVPWAPIDKGKTKDGKPVLTTGNSSGVTIGNGVDLSKVDTKTYLKELEKVGVSQATRDTLAPFLGKEREDACKALREAKKNGPLVLPAADVNLIDYHALNTRVADVKEQFNSLRKARAAEFQKQINDENKKKTPDPNKIKALQDQINNTRDFESLNPTEQTILYSTFYHEGRITRSHSVPIVNALIDNDPVAAEEALTAKASLPGKAKRLIAERGKRELNYLMTAQKTAKK
jgi:hypothetical protein